jgi:ATP-dependent Lhr-like helicase
VRTVIVDEIHAVIGTRRGAHLALSLERLAAASPRGRCSASACRRRRSRSRRSRASWSARRARADCAIVDEGPPARDRSRDRDAALAARAVMSHEVWEEYYDRLAS